MDCSRRRSDPATLAGLGYCRSRGTRRQRAVRMHVAGVAAILARMAPMIPVFHAVSQEPPATSCGSPKISAAKV